MSDFGDFKYFVAQFAIKKNVKAYQKQRPLPENKSVNTTIDNLDRGEVIKLSTSEHSKSFIMNLVLVQKPKTEIRQSKADMILKKGKKDKQV